MWRYLFTQRSRACDCRRYMLASYACRQLDDGLMARPRIIAVKVHREHLSAMLHFAHFMLLLIRFFVPHNNLSRSLENASVCSFRSIIIRHLLCRARRVPVHTFHTMWLIYSNVYYVNWMWVLWMRWCERTTATQPKIRCQQAGIDMEAANEWMCCALPHKPNMKFEKRN